MSCGKVWSASKVLMTRQYTSGMVSDCTRLVLWYWEPLELAASVPRVTSSSSVVRAAEAHTLGNSRLKGFAWGTARTLSWGVEKGSVSHLGSLEDDDDLLGFSYQIPVSAWRKSHSYSW